MSIFEKFFGAADKTDDQTQDPQNSPQQTQQQDPQAQSGLPAWRTQDQTQEPEDSLKRFGAVWAPMDPAKAPKAFNPAEINDLSKLPEVLSQQNYLQGTSAEDLQAIAGGGEQAVAAFGKILNQVAQTVAAQSITAASKLVENGVTKTIPAIDSRMQQFLKHSKVQDEISATNPLLANPAAAPLVQLFQQQVMAKYPQATPSEVAKMTNEYFTELSNGMQPKPQMDPTKKEEADWAKFFDIK